MSKDYPNIILLLSGKRKSGKDFIAAKVKSILKEKCSIVRISEPIKRHYAEQNNLDLNKLLGDSSYKETYRLAMIKWSDEVRSRDPAYFCRAACSQAPAVPIWIVSDIRRKTDVQFFKETYKDIVKITRISADLPVRAERGWVFTEGVDDAISECGLDDFVEWDLEVSNNNLEEFKVAVDLILKICTSQETTF